MSAASPAGAVYRYSPLFGVRFTHGYYNASGGACPDFRTVPTPATSQLMASLGLLFKDHGAGFSVLSAASSSASMQAYVAAQTGQGKATWLSFMLVPTNPGFVGITNLPISTSQTTQNLYVSNLETSTTDGALQFGSGDGTGAESLMPLTGSNLTVTTPKGATATLLDRSGKPAPAPATVADGTTSFALGNLPYGYYSVAFANSKGKAVAAPRGSATAWLYVPDDPRPLCMVDLLLAPPPGMKSAPAFPVTAPGKPLTSATIELAFQPRDTFWRYFVVSQARSGEPAPDLSIQGTGTSFAKSIATMPNGDAAVLFSAETALPLQQVSSYRFQLSGNRKGINGGTDDIRVDWLPAAPAAPVWPAPDGDALAGSSEIYVYV